MASIHEALQRRPHSLPPIQGRRPSQLAALGQFDTPTYAAGSEDAISRAMRLEALLPRPAPDAEGAAGSLSPLPRSPQPGGMAIVVSPGRRPSLESPAERRGSGSATPGQEPPQRRGSLRGEEAGQSPARRRGSWSPVSGASPGVPQSPTAGEEGQIPKRRGSLQPEGGAAPVASPVGRRGSRGGQEAGGEREAPRRRPSLSDGGGRPLSPGSPLDGEAPPRRRGSFGRVGAGVDVGGPDSLAGQRRPSLTPSPGGGRRGSHPGQVVAEWGGDAEEVNPGGSEVSTPGQAGIRRRASSKGSLPPESY
jgi:hypothetical protein